MPHSTLTGTWHDGGPACSSFSNVFQSFLSGGFHSQPPNQFHDSSRTPIPLRRKLNPGLIPSRHLPSQILLSFCFEPNPDIPGSDAAASSSSDTLHDAKEPGRVASFNKQQPTIAYNIATSTAQYMRSVRPGYFSTTRKLPQPAMRIRHSFIWSSSTGLAIR